MDSRTIQFIFIPPLIFDGSFALDSQIFLKTFWQIFYLAGPGVVINLVLIGVTLKYILVYPQLSIQMAMSIGSIIAATDPVVILSLLKEVGAPLRFNMILEGESLVNDGTGMLFFMIFYNWITVPQGLSDVIVALIRLCIGAVLLGMAVGFLTYPIFKRTIHHPSIALLLSVFLCYLIFFISESEMFGIKCSGILAILTYGLYLSAKLKTRMVGELDEKIHTLWHFLAHYVETILFFVTGGYVGVYLSNYDIRTFIGYGDILKVIVFQIALFLIRAISIVVLIPLLNRTGSYKIDWKACLVMTYAGLRGAIAMTLMLVVQ